MYCLLLNNCSLPVFILDHSNIRCIANGNRTFRTHFRSDIKWKITCREYSSLKLHILIVFFLRNRKKKECYFHSFISQDEPSWQHSKQSISFGILFSVILFCFLFFVYLGNNISVDEPHGLIDCQFIIWTKKKKYHPIINVLKKKKKIQ